MSLVPTYVLATDGLYYDTPTLQGTDFFVCFDDDDPPEIVLLESSVKNIKRTRGLTCSTNEVTRWLAERRLQGLGIGYVLEPKICKAGRCFGPRHRIKQAFSMFFELKTPIPPPRGMKGVDWPKTQCCVETGGLPYMRYGNAQRLEAVRASSRVP